MSLFSPGPPDAQSTNRRIDTTPLLILTELNPGMVIDGMLDADEPLALITFGTTREVCPKCQQGGLKLVLRQTSVRVAHLFCADCESCYDACYPDGAPALTI